MNKAIKALLSASLLLILTFMSPLHVFAADEAAKGHEYVVKTGDGLYSLGRKFFGKGTAFKKIVEATNAKAAEDNRFGAIGKDNTLEVGQRLWIPGVASVEPTVGHLDEIAKPDIQAIKTEVTPATTDEPLPKSEQAIIVDVPMTNCEIRIWYNYQIVAIKRINQRWVEEGLAIEERARRAYEMRHNARVNGRYMMADRFEVAALRDRDNKKYGHADGPTFEYLVARNMENGLEGDDIYNRIIENSARTNPVFKSSCGDK